MKKRSKKIIFVIIVFILMVSALMYILFFRNNDNNSLKENLNYEYSLEKVLDYNDFTIKQNGYIAKLNEGYIVSGDVTSTLDTVTLIYDFEGNDITLELLGNYKYELDFFFDNPDYYYLHNDYSSVILSKNMEKKVELNDHFFANLTDKYIIVRNIPYENNKYGVYHYDGKETIPVIYDNIQMTCFDANFDLYCFSDNKLDDFLIVALDNKVGVFNHNGENIIPLEYDIDFEETRNGKVYQSFQSYIVDDKRYFILKKDGKYGIISEDKEVIIEFKHDNLLYFDELNIIYSVLYDNDKIVSIDVFGLEGNFKKKINLNDNLSFVGVSYNANSSKKMLFFNDNENNTYILNSDLEFIKYDNPYYYVNEYIGGGVKFENSEIYYNSDRSYYIFDEIYIKKQDDKYNIFSKDNNKILNDSFVSFNLFDDNYILLCKDRKDGSNEYSYNDYNCGIIDYTGKMLCDFKYEQIYSTEIKLDDTHLLLDYNNSEIKETKCDFSGDLKLNSIYEKFLLVENKKSTYNNRQVYNLNCEKKISNISNIYQYNDDLIMTEIFQKNYKSYNFYNKELEKIEYKNDDNVNILLKLNTIGNNIDSNLYFSTDKGIYEFKKIKK